MFKKITSNRSPDTTVWAAFYEEFCKYIDGSIIPAKRLIEARPHAVFSIMVIAILISASCFLFLPKEIPKKEPLQLSLQQPLMDGMGSVVTTVSALKELLEIRTVLDTLMRKESLDSSDSLLMESAIDRMQILEGRLSEESNHQNLP
ncbi:hypothetical protein [Sphingobacterium chungjuense]|uniref:hypothetical protein n=1 Tax=Sphingobacterium chungjuense TaxID=2675553 RepID=UPI00140E1435|nr:hypothetical protein [Sphingobacterium chungjuense]